MIRGFFFDLDGTLVDTHQANYEAYKKALFAIGVTITFEDFKKTIGRQARDFLPELAPSISEDEKHEVARLKADYYKELMHLSRCNEQLITFIDAMTAHHTIALVTTAKKQNALAVLTHHKLTEKFDLIVTADDVEHSKPAPDGYLLALELSGLAAHEVIAFEDSQSGVDAASKANIPVVHIKDFAV